MVKQAMGGNAVGHHPLAAGMAEKASSEEDETNRAQPLVEQQRPLPATPS